MLVGDSDFAANEFVNLSGNRDFFLNTLSWLAEEENLIAVRPEGVADGAGVPDRRPEPGRRSWCPSVLIPLTPICRPASWRSPAGAAG